LCLTAHYRNFLDFSEELLQTAANSRNNLIKKMQKLFDQHSKIIIEFDTMPYEQLKEAITSKFVGDALEDMMSALMDDLNIPQVLAIINQSLNSLDKVEEVDKKDLFVALHWLEKNLLKV
jgi:cysteinyl-tRNA synthetase